MSAKLERRHKKYKAAAHRELIKYGRGVYTPDRMRKYKKAQTYLRYLANKKEWLKHQ